MKTNLNALMVFAVTLCSTQAVLAEPSVVTSFNGATSCFDSAGNLVPAESTRKVVFTNDGEGTVNVSIKGVCHATSSSAVNWSNFDFPVYCSAGNNTMVPYWKYHMRPDGKYSIQCSSYPLE